MDLMNKTDVLKYLVERNFFPQNAAFKCVDILEETKSEGYCNKLFQVIDENTNKSVVVKQVMPYMLVVKQATGDIRPFSMERIKTEISVLVFFDRLQKGIVPEIYLADFENGIIVMEDLCHLKLMRFEMTDGKVFYEAGKKIGAFLAALYFFTSRHVLSKEEQFVLSQYFDSTESGRLNVFLSDEECTLLNLTKKMEPEVMPIRKRIAENAEIRRIVKGLSDKFSDKECLAHNDLHSSNIMIDDDEVRIIDTEFSGFSTPYIDLGRMASSFVVNYLSWLGTPEIEIGKRREMQAYNLAMLRDMFNAYKNVLAALWQAYDVKASFEETALTIFKDALAYAVTIAILRVSSDIAQSCEIKRIRNREDLAHVQQCAYEVAEYVLTHLDQFRSIDDFTACLSEHYGL